MWSPMSDNVKPLRIAFFLGEFPILSETFVIRQVAGLVNAGHDVTIIAGKWGDRACAHETYRAHRLEQYVRPLRNCHDSRLDKLLCVGSFFLASLISPHNWRRLSVAIGAARKGSIPSLLDIAATGSRPIAEQYLGAYDAIIAHFGPVGVRAMHLQQAGLLDGPLAVVFHGADMSDRSTLAKHRDSYRELFVHAERLLPVSELWRRRLIEWGASPEKVEVVRMGVNLDRLAMRDPNRAFHTPLRVLSVARLTEKKGLRFAIEGILAAKRAIRFEIIGSGPAEAELRALSKVNPVNKEIVFLGSRSQQDVFSAMDSTDVLLLPSVTAVGGDMEGIPVILMEAMAKGVLVIASKHSGIPELIDHRMTGLLVPERDSKTIAEVLDSLGKGGPDIKPILISARDVVAREFDSGKLDARICQICEEMANGANGKELAGNTSVTTSMHDLATFESCHVPTSMAERNDG